MKLANSRKKCKQCGGYFPASEMIKVPAGTFCTMEHAVEFANERRKTDAEKIKKKIDTSVASEERMAAKQRRERLKELQPLSYYHKIAQREFNAYIRYRDRDLPCISCGRKNSVKMNAGHYRTVGASKETRYDEDNCHAQCEHCNSYLSGNIGNYKAALIKKIGQDRFDALMAYHPPVNWSRNMIEDIAKTYRQKLKELKRLTNGD